MLASNIRGSRSSYDENAPLHGNKHLKAPSPSSDALGREMRRFPSGSSQDNYSNEPGSLPLPTYCISLKHYTLRHLLPIKMSFSYPIYCFQDNTLHLQIICKRPFQMKFSFSLFVPMPPQPQPAIVITTLVRAVNLVARRVIKSAGTTTIAVPRSRCKALIVVVMPRMEDQSIRAKTARPWRRRVMRISTSS